MLIEEVILHFMPQIFENYNVESKSLIRITRNADIDIDIDEIFADEDISYRESMEELIRMRKKLCPIRMEYSRVLDEKVIKSLCKELGLNKSRHFIPRHHLIYLLYLKYRIFSEIIVNCFSKEECHRFLKT